MRLDLRAEPEVEPTLRRELEVVRGAGQCHRVAGEGDRDRGGELQPLGVLAREQQWKKRVVRALEGVHTVVAECLELLRRLRDGRELGHRQRRIDLHRGVPFS